MADRPPQPVKYDKLLNLARQAAENAYAPYSNFRVGAAVETEKGIFTGANIENASFGLSTCAERVAIANAVAAGAHDISAIAVACVDAPAQAPLRARTPCGACRQWIAELAPEAEIVLLGSSRIWRSSDFLPNAFSLHSDQKE